MRKDYGQHQLTGENSPVNPFELFTQWFNIAVEKNEVEANAMVLSSAGTDGRPSSRLVLLKDYSERGFVFFTNYRSRKSMQIESNPWVSLLFFWPSLERQVRIEGVASKVEPDESDAYFVSRPRESKLAAVISPQSQPLPDREYLEKKFNEAEGEYPDDIPRPSYWGGYRVTPVLFEFWQGRPGRLHDRLEYKYEKSVWIRQRLAP